MHKSELFSEVWCSLSSSEFLKEKFPTYALQLLESIDKGVKGYAGVSQLPIVEYLISNVKNPGSEEFIKIINYCAVIYDGGSELQMDIFLHNVCCESDSLNDTIKECIGELFAESGSEAEISNGRIWITFLLIETAIRYFPLTVDLNELIQCSFAFINEMFEQIYIYSSDLGRNAENLLSEISNYFYLRNPLEEKDPITNGINELFEKLISEEVLLNENESIAINAYKSIVQLSKSHVESIFEFFKDEFIGQYESGNVNFCLAFIDVIENYKLNDTIIKEIVEKMITIEDESLNFLIFQLSLTTSLIKCNGYLGQPLELFQMYFSSIMENFGELEQEQFACFIKCIIEVIKITGERFNCEIDMELFNQRALKLAGIDCFSEIYNSVLILRLIYSSDNEEKLNVLKDFYRISYTNYTDYLLAPFPEIINMDSNIFNIFQSTGEYIREKAFDSNIIGLVSLFKNKEKVGIAYQPEGFVSEVNQSIVSNIDDLNALDSNFTSLMKFNSTVLSHIEEFSEENKETLVPAIEDVIEKYNEIENKGILEYAVNYGAPLERFEDKPDCFLARQIISAGELTEEIADGVFEKTDEMEEDAYELKSLLLLAIAFYPEKQHDNIIQWLLSIAASFPFYFGSNLVLDAMNVVYQKIPDKTVHAIITAALIKCAIMAPRIHSFGVDIEDTNKLLWQYLQEEEIFAAIDEVFQQPGLNDYAESYTSFKEYAISKLSSQ